MGKRSGMFDRWNPRPDNVFSRDAGSKSPSVIRVVNKSDGVPAAIDAAGSFKCLTCSGFVEDALICEECREAITLFRAGANLEVLTVFLAWMTENPSTFRSLQRLTDEAMGIELYERIYKHTRG